MRALPGGAARLAEATSELAEASSRGTAFWTPQLEAYLNEHFTQARGPWSPLRVYVRNGLRLR